MKQILARVSSTSMAVALLAAAGTVAVVGSIAAVAHAQTTTTQITANVGSVISMLTSSGTVTLALTPTAAGVQSTASDTVTVSTNNATGYNLSIAETTASQNLVSGANNILPTSGTRSAPAALTANTWGYRVDSVGGFGAGPTTAGTNAAIGATTYAKVPLTASPDQLKTTNATATNDVTTVWYSAAVNTATPSGAYTNNVTYTALTN